MFAKVNIENYFIKTLEGSSFIDRNHIAERHKMYENGEFYYLWKGDCVDGKVDGEGRLDKFNQDSTLVLKYDAKYIKGFPKYIKWFPKRFQNV